MFMIPDYYDVTTLSFNEAIDVMTKHGRGDLLEGMESMNRIWSEYVESHNAFARGDVDEVTFGDGTTEELTANVIAESMLSNTNGHLPRG